MRTCIQQRTLENKRHVASLNIRLARVGREEIVPTPNSSVGKPQELCLFTVDLKFKIKVIQCNGDVNNKKTCTNATESSKATFVNTVHG